MVPKPGESGEWWANTGYPNTAPEDPYEAFLHDVPTSYLLCRDDRFLPANWTRAMVRDRLGIEPEEIDGGHCPFLARPEELAARLEAIGG